MSIALGRHHVAAVFDAAAYTSKLPASYLKSLFGMKNIPTNITLPVTITGVVVPLTTTVAFEIYASGPVVLGRNWFACYREYYINLGLVPPLIDTFSLEEGSAPSGMPPALSDLSQGRVQDTVSAESVLDNV
ncbi:hypothetical protein DXG01_001089, partial [Tephrocybe rancida]